MEQAAEPADRGSSDDGELSGVDMPAVERADVDVAAVEPAAPAVVIEEVVEVIAVEEGGTDLIVVDEVVAVAERVEGEPGEVVVEVEEAVVDVTEEPEPEAAPEPEPSIGQGYGELLAAAEQVLDEVDGALARLRDGSYGSCEVCGDGIADDLLAVRPTARTCERHLPLAEAS